MTRHGLGSVPTGPSLALVASLLDVIFQNKSFFEKGVIFRKVSAYGGNLLCWLPMGDASTLSTCLSRGGLAHGAALNLAVWLCRGCFPMEAVKAWKHAQGLAIAITACPWELP